MPYEVPEVHAALLRTMLSIGEADAIPDAVTKAYFALRRPLDRINAGFSTELLAVVVVNSGANGQNDSCQPPQVGWDGVAPGSAVLAGHRAGRFLGTEQKGKQGNKRTLVRVQFDDGPDGLFELGEVSVAEETLV